MKQLRDWTTADKIRDELRTRGIEVYDKEREWRAADGRSGLFPPPIADSRDGGGRDAGSRVGGSRVGGRDEPPRGQGVGSKRGRDSDGGGGEGGGLPEELHSDDEVFCCAVGSCRSFKPARISYQTIMFLSISDPTDSR